MLFHSDENLNYRGGYIDNIQILYKEGAYDCTLGEVNQDGYIDVNDIVNIINVC